MLRDQLPSHSRYEEPTQTWTIQELMSTLRFNWRGRPYSIHVVSGR